MAPSGKPRIVLDSFHEIGITQQVSQRPADKHRRQKKRATACVVACAPPPAFFLYRRRRLGSDHSQGLLGGRRSPKMPRTEQRRRWSYRSLDRILLDPSLGFRDFWAIELVEKLGLRPPRFVLRRHRRGTLCYGL